jgi:hypothetical protein
MLPEAVPARELVRLTPDWRVTDHGDAWCLERRLTDGWHLWRRFRHRKNLLTFVYERGIPIDRQVRRQLWHWPSHYRSSGLTDIPDKRTIDNGAENTIT